ncbi:uncharacterized protein CMU_011330 [Cryptosporidium muris RN66]|uniref:PIN domain-containing protein n=1 Tax=Cryptosporidium muris (strain RN66) TaxID=441375 RepID=B6AIZ3_CRYMR|nr:uncharacterized protein CMU_011330 [Cryptosporidium muris RN66]EEA08184.1 hypothetical protein, conserved [Cryptosporidium muris RN66]|eukprot:XP_002142533.1 hypothetical protein [Cryptosporidium muris RN66]
MNFKFTEPYRILVDGTFILAALKVKFHIKEQLSKILCGRITPIVSNCIVKEIETLNFSNQSTKADFSGAKLAARAFFRYKCNHIYETDTIEKQSQSILYNENINAIDPSIIDKDSEFKNKKKFDSFRCILDIVSKSGNSKKFIVATQDVLLRKKLRKIPGVPIIYLYNQIPILESPSQVTCSQQFSKEQEKLLPQKWEYSYISCLRNTLNQDSKTKEKRRKRKNPNPLSCIKKKKKPDLTSQNKDKKKRTRTRNKVKI